MLSQRQAFRNRPRQGLIEICLGDHDRLLIADLAGQFRSLLSEGDDPALQRLYPNAYPDHPEHNVEYGQLVHDDLLRGRLEAIEVVEATAQEPSLSLDQLNAWITVVSGLRLVVGTRLDVSEQDEFDPEAEDAPMQSLLWWLAMLLDEAVTAASHYLPDPLTP